MPLPLSAGTYIFLGSDVMTFLNKYESLAIFTSTDPTSCDAGTMFPSYCVQGTHDPDTVVMMRRYVECDWVVLTTEMLDVFRVADSRSRDDMSTHRYLEELCAKFRCQDDMETLMSYLRTYNHISGVVTDRGMMVKNERMEMLLHALPKRLWRKVITKFGLNLLELCTFEYGKLKGWIAARIAAVEALTMFDFLAPTSPPAMKVSPAPLAPTASTSPMAPTRTEASPVVSTPATPKTHKTSPASTTSPASATTSLAALASPAPLAPAAAETITTISMAAEVPLTTVTIFILPSAPSPAARQGTIRAGLTVRLGIIRVAPRRGPPVHRHRSVQPRHCEEPARPNRQVTDK